MDAWIQCSNPDCGKWRNIRNFLDLNVMPEIWFCSMNDDPESNSCDKPEIKYSSILSACLRKPDKTSTMQMQTAAVYYPQERQLLPPAETLIPNANNHHSASFASAPDKLKKYIFKFDPSRNLWKTPQQQTSTYAPTPLIQQYSSSVTATTLISNDFCGTQSETKNSEPTPMMPAPEATSSSAGILATELMGKLGREKSASASPASRRKVRTKSTKIMGKRRKVSEIHENQGHKDGPDRLLPCGICGREFLAYPPNGGTLRIWKLREHVTLHFDGAVWKCPLCNFDSKNKQNVYLHLTKSRKHGEAGIGEKPELAITYEEYLRQFRETAPKCFPEQASQMIAQ